MKICVYAICKDERQFVSRWYESMKEADAVVVLDTGSTDGTPEALRACGATVEVGRIDPWRFDVARNESLRLVPSDADICVCTDLDEVFLPGWRAALERAWQPGTQRARYRYTWSFRPDGSEGTVLWPDKIHAARGYRWIYPVHEVLAREDGRCETAEEVVVCPDVFLHHHPDPTKSRRQYLGLLELAARENPSDARTLHYLGREYMFAGQWEKCIFALTRHLSLPSSDWAEERCASWRFISRAQRALGQRSEAQWSLYRALSEAPHLREPYYELASLFWEDGNALGAAFMAQEALNIRSRPEVYVSEDIAWGEEPARILSAARKTLRDQDNFSAPA